ncbi:CDP-diacylglycerol--glycerol-3-phosphate 3-phosphatidyltransferase [Kiritimatiellaeota bacterium B1221]|nr:CDP-diacylglycerol--glycerol-3-phosphate 3-phosphatidyltransferase [Kiritimatiellaeota bacterium B1221]
MNVPNQLTCSRFVFALLMLFCLSFSFPYAKSLGLLLFVVASITDALDGYLARNKYGCTAFGKLMDPLADKVLVTVALVSFVEIRFDLAYPAASLVPAFLVVPILIREFMVTGLRLLAVEKGEVISAGSMGKWKTVLQMIAIIFTLISLALVEDFLSGINPDTLKSVEYMFHWIIWILMGAAMILTLLSGAEYFVKHHQLFTSDSDEKN